MKYPEASYPLLKYAFTRLPIRFIAFMLGTIACVYFAFDVWQPVGKAILAGMAVAIQLILWIGSYQHREKLRTLNADTSGNPLNHHVELWDAAPYNCIHGVKPDKHTHECAWPIMHDGIPMPTLKERKIQVKI